MCNKYVINLARVRILCRLTHIPHRDKVVPLLTIIVMFAKIILKM